jgi:rubrerythrin
VEFTPDVARTPIDTALFLIPHSLMGQWADYVKRDTNLKCLFIKTKKDATGEELTVEKLRTYDAIFVSTTMWRDFSYNAPLDLVLWSRFFMDEADSATVSMGSIPHARFIWLISASWMNLIFSHGAYLNVQNAYSPPPTVSSEISKKVRRFVTGEHMHLEGTRNVFVRKLCGSYSLSNYNLSSLNSVMFQATRMLVHSSEDYVRASFHIPPIHHLRYLCLAPPNIQVLSNMISAEMMERLHAGDAEGVLEMLGMTTKSAEDITTAITDSIQKELDGVRKLYDFKKTMEYATESSKQKALEHLEDKMARLQSRIDAIQNRLKNPADEQCPICFCEVQKPALTPCCRHLFCFGCICEVMKRTSVCPMCRETIPNIQAVQVIGGAAESSGDTEEPAKTEEAKPEILTKQEQFRAFLKANPDARVLMFSGYDATFSGLSNVLLTDGVSHATLQGSQARIAKLIREFEAGKYRVLFLNSRNMGAGLNIMPATHVVLYHRMSAETQNQIIGRAMRMGRTQSLTVVHLLHGNEMTASDAADVVNPNVISHV